MKVHQILQKSVTCVFPYDDVIAVLQSIDHKVSAAVLSTIGEGVANPTFTDSDEEVARWFGHQ